MTIRALVYGGVQIGGIVTKAHKTFDGVWLELRGSTLSEGRFVPAGATLEMSASDALDLALALFLAADEHGEYASKAPSLLVKRLVKRMARKKK